MLTLQDRIITLSTCNALQYSLLQCNVVIRGSFLFRYSLFRYSLFRVLQAPICYSATFAVILIGILIIVAHGNKQYWYLQVIKSKAMHAQYNYYEYLKF